MSYYREQLEDWLKTLDVKADIVLDIGGAQGEVRKRVKSWDVKEYKVLDLPGFNIEEDTYDEADIIFVLEVFEYLTRPLEALWNIYYSLKIGGRAYVTFAFVYPHHNELNMDSLRYTQPGIELMAEDAKLIIENIWYRRDRTGLLKAFYQADGMKMAREYPNHDVTGFIVEFKK